MYPACLTVIFTGATGGAGLLAWFKLHRRGAKRNTAPPSATFQEWVVAVVSREEARQALERHRLLF